MKPRMLKYFGARPRIKHARKISSIFPLPRIRKKRNRVETVFNPMGIMYFHAASKYAAPPPAGKKVYIMIL
jgi:hypothetical protein